MYYETEGMTTKVEQFPTDLVAEKKAKAQQIAKELHDLMDVTPEEWIKDIRATRHKVATPIKEMQ